MSLTDQAQGLLGDYVEKACKTKLVVRCQNVFGGQVAPTITPDEVARYYAEDAFVRKLAASHGYAPVHLDLRYCRQGSNGPSHA